MYTCVYIYIYAYMQFYAGGLATPPVGEAAARPVWADVWTDYHTNIYVNIT